MKYKARIRFLVMPVTATAPDGVMSPLTRTDLEPPARWKCEPPGHHSYARARAGQPHKPASGGALGQLLQRTNGCVSDCLFLLGPVAPARIRATHQIHDVLPTARLDPRVAVTPRRRSAMRLREPPNRRCVDTQVHSVLVQ
jgi:hypothetical protein